MRWARAKGGVRVKSVMAMLGGNCLFYCDLLLCENSSRSVWV